MCTVFGPVKAIVIVYEGVIFFAVRMVRLSGAVNPSSIPPVKKVNFKEKSSDSTGSK